LGFGLLFGVVLAYGAYQVSQDPSNYWLTVGATLVLAFVVGSFFFRTGQLTPAAQIAAVASGMVMRCVVRSKLATKQQA